MTPDLVLHQKLVQASRRVRALLIYRWSTRALCWTAGACVLWLLAAKLRWAPEPAPGVLASMLVVAALIGVGIGFTTRLSLLDVARLTDGRTSMKERLASAVEFEARAQDDPLVLRQIEDARAHAAELDLSRVYPIRPSRELYGFAVLAILLFGALFLPTLPVFWSQREKQEREQVRKEGFQIEHVARDTEKYADQNKLGESKKAATEAKKLAAAMKRGELSKKDAMVRIAKLTQQMQDQQKRLAEANTPAAKPMEKAAEEFRQSLAQQQKAIEQAAQAKANAAKQGQAKSGQKPGAQKPGSQKSAQNAQNEKQTQSMQQAQQAMQQLADALSKQDSAAQNDALQKLADQLQKGQMTPQEMQQVQKQVQALSEALMNTKLDKASQQLAQLARQMQGRKMDPQTLNKMAQLARQAGAT